MHSIFNLSRIILSSAIHIIFFYFFILLMDGAERPLKNYTQKIFYGTTAQCGPWPPHKFLIYPHQLVWPCVAVLQFLTQKSILVFSSILILFCILSHTVFQSESRATSTSSSVKISTQDAFQSVITVHSDMFYSAKSS